jgi:hypothetical protein
MFVWQTFLMGLFVGIAMLIIAGYTFLRPGNAGPHPASGPVVLVAAIAILLVLLLVLAVGVMFYEGTFSSKCSTSCGATLPTFSVNAVDCTISNRTCELVLYNPSTVDLQAVGCFWDSPSNGTEIGNGTLSTATPPITSSPTVHPDSSITVFCSNYPGTPTLGAAVVPGIRLAGNVSIAFSGTSEGPYVWK